MSLIKCKSIIKNLVITCDVAKNLNLGNNQNLQTTCILNALNKVQQTSDSETKNDRGSNLVIKLIKG